MRSKVADGPRLPIVSQQITDHRFLYVLDWDHQWWFLHADRWWPVKVKRPALLEAP
jgi:hypothetical protein